MIAVLMAIWSIVFVAALRHYPGSGGIYALFSIVFLILLGSAFVRQSTYGYLFLVLFLWLGFWLKISVHQIFTYPFGEPVGRFDGSPAEWDNVLLVATSGCVGVLMARIVYGWLSLRSTLLGRPPVAPPWYPQIRRVLWVALAIVVVGSAALNIVYGIQQSGLVPRTIVLWPLNAGIFWMLTTGFAMCVLTLLWWQLALRNSVLPSAFMLLVEAAVSTTSLLSRGVFIFQAVPTLLALYVNRRRATDLSPLRVAVYVATFVALTFVAVSTANTLRNYYYVGPGAVVATTPAIPFADKVRDQIMFSIDRWIGAEGVMAISSYDGKGADLFLKAFDEKPAIGKSTFYQEVSNSHYDLVDANKFTFATLPGAIAFFYYTGSLYFVALGMIVFTFLVLSSEQLVSVMTGNPFLSSFWGCAAADVVAQFGLAPRNGGPYLIMCAVAFLVIWIVQSGRFALLLRRIGLGREASLMP